MDIFWVTLFSGKTTNDINNWCSFFGLWKFFIGKFSHVCSFPLESFDLMHQCIVNSKFRIWSLLTVFFIKNCLIFLQYLCFVYGTWQLTPEFPGGASAKHEKNHLKFKELNPGESLLIAILPGLFWTYPGIKPESQIQLDVQPRCHPKKKAAYNGQNLPTFSGSADCHVVFTRTYPPVI